MDDVNLLFSDKAHQNPDIRETAKKAPIVDGHLDDPGLGPMAKTARSDEDLVALFDLLVDDGRCRSFGPGHEIAAQNMEDIHGVVL